MSYLPRSTDVSRQLGIYNVTLAPKRWSIGRKVAAMHEDAHMVVVVATDNDPSPFYATQYSRVHRDPVLLLDYLRRHAKQKQRYRA